MIVSEENLSFSIIKNREIIYRNIGTFNITAMIIYNNHLVVGSDDRFIRLYDLSNYFICSSLFICDIPIYFNIKNNSLSYYCRNGKIGQFLKITKSFEILYSIYNKSFDDRKGQFNIVDSENLSNHSGKFSKEEVSLVLKKIN